MDQIQATIITIGDELLIGQVIDTNSAFIAQKLNAIGVQNLFMEFVIILILHNTSQNLSPT